MQGPAPERSKYTTAAWLEQPAAGTAQHWQHVQQLLCGVGDCQPSCRIAGFSIPGCALSQNLRLSAPQYQARPARRIQCHAVQAYIVLCRFPPTDGTWDNTEPSLVSGSTFTPPGRAFSSASDGHVARCGDHRGLQAPCYATTNSSQPRNRSLQGTSL